MIESVKIQGDGYKATIAGTEWSGISESSRFYPMIQEWIAEGNTPWPEFTQAELDNQIAEEKLRLYKKNKQIALSTITVTTSLGNEFDGNESARNNMLSAIQASAFTGSTSTRWVMASNDNVTVTLDELKEALTLAIQVVGSIVTGERGV